MLASNHFEYECKILFCKFTFFFFLHRMFKECSVRVALNIPNTVIGPHRCRAKFANFIDINTLFKLFYGSIQLCSHHMRQKCWKKIQEKMANIHICNNIFISWSNVIFSKWFFDTQTSDKKVLV